MAERGGTGWDWAWSHCCPSSRSPLPVSHLCHILWVLRRPAEDLLQVALEVGKEVAGLGVHAVQGHARAVLHLLLERSAHRAALDEAQAGSR